MLVSIAYIENADKMFSDINNKSFNTLTFIDDKGKEIEITKNHIELVKSLNLTNTDFIINGYYKSNKLPDVVIEKFMDKLDDIIDSQVDQYLMKEFVDDIEEFRQQFLLLGIKLSHFEVYKFWEYYSESLCAGWLHGAVNEYLVNEFISKK